MKNITTLKQTGPELEYDARSPRDMLTEVCRLGAVEMLAKVIKDEVETDLRRTKRRLLIDPAHYEGSSTDMVTAPVPLGRLTRRITDLWDIPVSQRPLDLYEQLLKVRHGDH